MSSLLAKVGRLLRKPPVFLAPPPPPPEVVDLSPPEKPKMAFPGVIPLGRHWATTECIVSERDAHMRLDRFITNKFDISKSLLQKIMRKHLVWVERPDLVSTAGQIVEDVEIAKHEGTCGFRVQPGDVVTLSEVFLKEKNRPFTVPLQELTEEHVSELQKMVLFMDENLIIINKPSGITVHEDGSKTHLRAFLEAFRFGEPNIPYVVHRLDRGTSGVLLLARHRQAAEMLAERFRTNQEKKSIKKIYWAMVKDVPLVASGRIVTNIYESADTRKNPSPDRSHLKMTSIADRRADMMDEGKVAITDYRVIGPYISPKSKRKKLALVEFKPLTGRTHQLRVHASEQLGTPIVGDFRYGGYIGDRTGLHLHSRKLVLYDYPKPGTSLSVSAPIPPHFIKTMTEYPAFLNKKPKFPKKKRHNAKNYVN